LCTEPKGHVLFFYHSENPHITNSMSQEAQQHPENESTPIGGVRHMWVMVVDARDASQIGRHAFDIVPDTANNPTARALLNKFLENPGSNTFDDVGEGGNYAGLVDEDSDEDPDVAIQEIIDYIDTKIVDSRGKRDNEYFPSIHRGRNAPEKYISLVQY